MLSMAFVAEQSSGAPRPSGRTPVDRFRGRRTIWNSVLAGRTIPQGAGSRSPNDAAVW